MKTTLENLKGGNEHFRYKGYCSSCDSNSTFNESKYCNQCGMHHVQQVNDLNTNMGSFTVKDIINEREFQPEVPGEIIDELTGRNQEQLPPRKNTKNKLKKQNRMKKSLVNFGKSIAKGTCKTLGGIHFVVQTSADAVAATEALIRERAFNENKEQAFMDRKNKTANYQLEIAVKLNNKLNQEKQCVKSA